MLTDHLLQAFAEQQCDAFDIHRCGRLEALLLHARHAALQRAVAEWRMTACRVGWGTESALVACSSARAFATQLALLRAFDALRDAVARVRDAWALSAARAEVRHLESLCVRLKLERAEQAYAALASR